jgi:hypothetical protein
MSRTMSEWLPSFFHSTPLRRSTFAITCYWPATSMVFSSIRRIALIPTFTSSIVTGRIELSRRSQTGSFCLEEVTITEGARFRILTTEDAWISFRVYTPFSMSKIPA